MNELGKKKEAREDWKILKQTIREFMLRRRNEEGMKKE
jgi:hypothetical protein